LFKWFAHCINLAIVAVNILISLLADLLKLHRWLGVWTIRASVRRNSVWRDVGFEQLTDFYFLLDHLVESLWDILVDEWAWLGRITSGSVHLARLVVVGRWWWMLLYLWSENTALRLNSVHLSHFLVVCVKTSLLWVRTLLRYIRKALSLGLRSIKVYELLKLWLHWSV
jgi:hypothetical protein